ncbi:MAG: hypothetical protein JKY65_06680 [Planctomycetes bacterium]|nr:hypothetical protein [Planctomycetota bacterium]
MGDLDAAKKFRASRIRGRVGKGKIVGSYFTKGAQIKGKSKAEFEKVMRANKVKAAKALEKTRIPKRMAEYVRDYIDSVTPERQ